MGLTVRRTSAFMAFLISLSGLSQSYHGFVDDNFNGVYGVVANPANVVDSRHRLNINVASFNSLLSSDFQTPKLGDANALNQASGLFRNGFDSWLFRNAENGGIAADGVQTTLANLDFLAPVSFMAEINQRHAIGLLLRARAIYNYNNIDGSFWNGLANGFDQENDVNFLTQDLDVTTHYWSEVGITYGAVLVNDGTHFFKAGGTLKLLLGQGVEQIYVDDQQGQLPLQSNLVAGTTSENNQIELSGGFTYVRSFTENTNAQTIGYFDRLGDAAQGIGGDVGVVYEYRTRATSRVPIGRNGGGFNKYKLKLALSLLDLGRIKYKDIPGVNTYRVNISQPVLFNADELSSNFLNTISANNGGSVNVERPGGDVEVALPTSIQLSADLLLRDGYPFYLNGSFNSTLVQSALPFNNNRINLYALTPRYEQKHFSFYAPLSYSGLSSFQVGFGARLGPVTLGTASIINIFTGDEKLNTLYFGANIPLLQDRDQNFRRRGKYHKKRRRHHRFSRRRRR
ncbi:MAG: hypothetical protein AAF039_04760 [Bacteroidota bacterium]